MGEPSDVYYIADGVRICKLCMDGEGGECHSPGCVFWITRAPDLAMQQKIEDFGGTVRLERDDA